MGVRMTIPRLFVFVLSAWLLTGCQFPQISPSEPVETSPAQKTTADTQTPSCDWSLPPYNPEGITEQKLAKQTADSLSRQWKNAHAHTGLPCPGREEELSMFFDQLGAWQAGLPEARDPATLLATAEILRSAPCDDPALLHAHGLLLQEAGRYTEAFDLFLQAAARYDQLGASGILKARNAVAIYTVIHQIGDDHDKDQCFRWKDRALEFLAQGVARDTFRPEDLRPLHAHISEHWKKIYWTRDGDQRHTGDELIAAANARLSHFENDLGALLTAPLLADPGYIRRKTIAQYASLVADGPTILAGQEWDEALADYEDNARALVGHVDKAIAEALDVGLALRSDGQTRLIRAAAALVPVAEDPHRTPLERASARQTIIRLLDGVVPVPSAWLASVERLDVIEPVQDAPPWEKPLRS